MGERVLLHPPGLRVAAVCRSRASAAIATAVRRVHNAANDMGRLPQAGSGPENWHFVNDRAVHRTYTEAILLKLLHTLLITLRLDMSIHSLGMYGICFVAAFIHDY